MTIAFPGTSLPDRNAHWLLRAAPSRLMAAAGCSLFSLLASIVLLRRLTGGFSGSISLLGYVACLIAAALICCGLKIVAEWPPHRLDRRANLVFGIVVGLPLDLLAVSLLPENWSYPWLVWTLGVPGLATWFCLSIRSVDGLRHGIQNLIIPEIERFLCPAQTFAGNAATVRVLAQADSGDILSELQRRTTETGSDVLQGQLAAVFAAGTRQAVLHVPFIPPFAEVPRVECEVTDGSETRVKVGAVFPYGARLELKRSTADFAESRVRLEIYVEVGSTSSDVAA